MLERVERKRERVGSERERDGKKLRSSYKSPHWYAPSPLVKL